ncbi:MAG TPA: hypothetical protein VF812_15995, partial [Ktedonobacterales bacterium]
PGDGIPRGAAVTSVLPDPQRAGVVFAGTSQGLYRSAHYGDHWSAYSSGLPSGAAAVALAATPDDATLLAGLDHGGMFRSVDDGATWTASDSGLPSQATPVALIWDATDHLWLAGLLDVSGAQIFASADNGQTWSPRASGLPAGASVSALAALGGASGATSAMLFAATAQGLYSSATSGQSWSRVSGGLPQGSALALATLAQQPAWVYVAIGASVYRSTDSGAHWRLVTGGLPSAPQGMTVTQGKHSGPVVYVAVGQVARYPTGVPAGSDTLGILTLILALLALVGGGYLISRRMRRFGYAMGALRNERNSGRAADAATRWSGADQTGAASDVARASGPRGRVTGEAEHEDGGRTGARQAIAPSDLTSRATTGAPADDTTSAQNGHGQPQQRD